MDIEQIEWLRDQEFAWLTTNPITDPYYNRHREMYEGYNNTIIQYYNSKAERRTKIIAACISGGIGLLGIGAATIIGNSSLGAKFDNSMKGLSGRITGNHF